MPSYFLTFALFEIRIKSHDHIGALLGFSQFLEPVNCRNAVIDGSGAIPEISGIGYFKRKLMQVFAEGIRLRHNFRPSVRYDQKVDKWKR
jgi:hypothetical protein